MAKLSASEISAKIDALEIDENEKISLMEDIADSIVDSSEELSRLQESLDTVKAELDDVRAKYKERFLNSNEVVTESETEQEVIEGEYKESEIIDVSEI